MLSDKVMSENSGISLINEERGMDIWEELAISAKNLKDSLPLTGNYKESNFLKNMGKCNIWFFPPFLLSSFSPLKSVFLTL